MEQKVISPKQVGKDAHNRSNWEPLMTAKQRPPRPEAAPGFLGA